MTRLGSRMSYRQAREELELLWKVRVSQGSMQQVTMRHGRIAEELVREKVAYLEATAATPSAQPEQLVMCTDGAMVQVTSGEWREVKTVTFGEFRPYWDAKERQVVTRTDQVSYFSRVEAAEDFNRSALVEWHRRGGEHAHTVVAVNDGALWIQAFIDYHCPQAVRVLDFAHAQQYLATVGRAILGPETAAFRQWYARMSKQLGRQPPQRTVNELWLLRRQHPDHAEGEAIEGAIRYLERRLPMIDYPHFRRQQVPIGSGMVESGHIVVMQQRMKQAGMRWAEVNLNPMLALRVALCNQTWKTTWREIEARVSQKKHARHTQQLPTVTQTPASRLVTAADCQRLSALADQIGRKKRQPWRTNNRIFPYRPRSVHRT
jgi:hypothetical protein